MKTLIALKVALPPPLASIETVAGVVVMLYWVVPDKMLVEVTVLLAVKPVNVMAMVSP